MSKHRVVNFQQIELGDIIKFSTATLDLTVIGIQSTDSDLLSVTVYAQDNGVTHTTLLAPEDAVIIRVSVDHSRWEVTG